MLFISWDNTAPWWWNAEQHPPALCTETFCIKMKKHSHYRTVVDDYISWFGSIYGALAWWWSTEHSSDLTCLRWTTTWVAQSPSNSVLCLIKHLQQEQTHRKYLQEIIFVMYSMSGLRLQLLGVLNVGIDSYMLLIFCCSSASYPFSGPANPKIHLRWVHFSPSGAYLEILSPLKEYSLGPSFLISPKSYWNFWGPLQHLAPRSVQNLSPNKSCKPCVYKHRNGLVTRILTSPAQI